MVARRTPGWRRRRGAVVSELGEQGASNALLWDIGGFGGMAVLYALYAVAIRAELAAGWLFRLVALQAIATAGSGLLSCDAGCPPVALSTSGSLHTVFGLTYFTTIAMVPFVAWRLFRTRAEWRSLARISLWTGTLLAALFLIGPFMGIDRVGAWQRVWTSCSPMRGRSRLPFGSIGCWIALMYTKLQALLLGEREQLNHRCPTFECRV